jgi:choice-of-anchor B domain-containing protein
MKKIYLGIATFFSVALMAQTPNLNIDFKSNVPFGTVSSDLSNICGYTTPSGTEYALVGWEQGVRIYDVTNPTTPVFITNITGPTSIWREIKVNGTYAYITTEGGGGLKIANLANLPNTNIPIVDWTGPINGNTIGNIHALHIDNNKVYLYGATSSQNSGAIVADISGVNATAPVYLGTYTNPSGAYVHDGYVRNDTMYAAHINNGFMSIAVFNNANGTSNILANNIVTPTAFTHNTWLTADSKYLFTTDENSNSFLGAYDITNPTTPTEIARTQSQNPNSGSIIHNTHILKKNNGGEYAVTSWYKDGVVITDITRPTNPVNVGWYDTFAQGTGGGFDGCWGVYPFFPSGNLVCSDITNGLYVLQPTYVRACYFEGTVIDSTTNAPINNAAISIALTSGNLNTTSNFTGDFKTGYPTSGTYTVTVSKAGYLSETFTISLSNGVVTTKTVKLKTALPITATITVLSAVNGLPIANARVNIEGTSGIFNVTTNGSGIATLNNFPSGNDQIIAAKWGYVTQCISNFNFSSSTNSATITLPKGYYDDFSTNNNWTVTTTASTGAWVRGTPLGTANNAGSDILDDCGNKAFVTGNTGVTASDDDVDAGNTILRSPKFVLVNSSNSVPYIQFSRWFVNVGGSGVPNDSLAIRLKVNGQSFTLDKATVSSAGNGFWVKKIVNVANKFATGDSLQIEVYIADDAPGHIVEGGFDGFRGIDSLSVGLNNIPNVRSLNIYPNPNSGQFIIEQSNANDLLDYMITDVLGRTVANGIFTSQKQVLDLKQHKGIYQIEIRNKDGQVVLTDKIIVID